MWDISVAGVSLAHWATVWAEHTNFKDVESKASKGESGRHGYQLGGWGSRTNVMIHSFQIPSGISKITPIHSLASG